MKPGLVLGQYNATAAVPVAVHSIITEARKAGGAEPEQGTETRPAENS